MRFSVLVPVYNVERYIKQCLDSVVGQSFEDYEVIVIDDGSTDASGGICDSYAGEKIHVIHRENRGLLLTRREAVSISRGEYCVFCDSDDYMDCDALRQLAEAIDRTRADVILFNFHEVNDSNDIIDSEINRFVPFERDILFRTEEEKDRVYELMVTGQGLNNLWSKAVKTDLLKEDPTDYSVMTSSMGEDWAQSLYPVFHAETIFYLNRYLYHYRMSEEGMTRAFSTDQMLNEQKKFNPPLYDLCRSYVERCIHTDAVLKQLQVYTLHRLVALYLKGYKCCQTRDQKKIWLGLDWIPMIPQDIIEEYQNKTLPLSFAEKTVFYCIIKQKSTLFAVLVFLGEMRRKLLHR